MTAKEFRHAIAALGLSQRKAAIALGVNERTTRRWAAGNASIAPTYASLLGHMLRQAKQEEKITDTDTLASNWDDLMVFMECPRPEPLIIRIGAGHFLKVTSTHEVGTFIAQKVIGETR